MINFLGWDTNFFGFKIGSVDLSNKSLFGLDKIINEIKNVKYKLVYLYTDINSNLNSNFENMEMTLADTQLLLEMDIPKKIKSVEYEILNYNNFMNYKKIFKNIYDIARDISIYSRFYNDKKISKSQVKKLYIEMVNNSINNTYGNGLILDFLNNELAGFFSIGVDKTNARELLIGVRSSFRDKGIGKKLFLKSLSFCKNNNIDSIKAIVSARNINSVNFHFKLGYSIYKMLNVYHVWVNN